MRLKGDSPEEDNRQVSENEANNNRELYLPQSQAYYQVENHPEA
jgi:hypothetical protein